MSAPTSVEQPNSSEMISVPADGADEAKVLVRHRQTRSGRSGRGRTR